MSLSQYTCYNVIRLLQSVDKRDDELKTRNAPDINRKRISHWLVSRSFSTTLRPRRCFPKRDALADHLSTTAYQSRSDSIDSVSTCGSIVTLSTDKSDSQLSVSLPCQRSCSGSPTQNVSVDSVGKRVSCPEPAEYQLLTTSTLQSQSAPMTLENEENLAISKGESGITRSESSARERPKLLRETSKLTRRQQCELAGNTLFNLDPVDGIRYLKENGIIGVNDEDVAQFILTSSGLCRIAIGEYLGKINDPNANSVMRNCIRMIDMDSRPIDEALRAVLSYFHPSGESQQITSLVKAFKEVYYEKNRYYVEETFRQVDTIEILAYSIMMLHTDAHNPNLSQRMTEEQFVRNNRGIDNGSDVSPELLRVIYRRVVQREFKTLPDPQVNLRLVNARLTGSLRTEKLMQRHKRFVGWANCEEVREFISRKSVRHHWRTIFLFNDVAVIAKPADRSSRRVRSTPRKDSSKTVGHSVDRASTDTNASRLVDFSSEPMKLGLYHIRNIIPLLEKDIIVFESLGFPFGVQICDEKAPVYSLNLGSERARQAVVGWLRSSIAEMTEIKRYHDQRNLRHTPDEGKEDRPQMKDKRSQSVTDLPKSSLSVQSTQTWATGSSINLKNPVDL